MFQRNPLNLFFNGRQLIGFYYFNTVIKIVMQNVLVFKILFIMFLIFELGIYILF